MAHSTLPGFSCFQSGAFDSADSQVRLESALVVVVAEIFRFLRDLSLKVPQQLQIALNSDPNDARIFCVRSRGSVPSQGSSQGSSSQGSVPAIRQLELDTGLPDWILTGAWRASFEFSTLGRFTTS